MRMNRLTEAVLQTIGRHRMIDAGATVIAAVSGGADSLCMLYVLNELRALRRFDLCAAHLNHGFRNEADGDEHFVANECDKLGVAFYSKKVDAAGYAASHKVSFETAGRALRYAYFDELMQAHENSVTATAHNANDNAESFMMHLLRGSGLSGLSGIPPVRGRIIRPLIGQTRRDIEQYCRDRRLSPRVDLTNFDDSYTRNDLRLNVMPLLDERGGTGAIVRTAQLLCADEDFLQAYTREVSDKYMIVREGCAEIDVKAFNALHLAIRRRLLKQALGCGDKELGLVHIDSVVALAEKNYGGKHTVLPGGTVATVQKGKLILRQGNLNTDPFVFELSCPDEVKDSDQ